MTKHNVKISLLEVNKNNVHYFYRTLVHYKITYDHVHFYRWLNGLLWAVQMYGG